jgi:hypothetical protein
MRNLALTAFCVACAALPAQTVVKPFQASPAASVSQELGLSTVKIDYHRPGVKGRKIFGGLVPFGQVWRAGANEAIPCRPAPTACSPSPARTSGP